MGSFLKDFKLLPILISHELKENELEEISNVLFKIIKTDLENIYSLTLNRFLYNRFLKVQKINGIKNKSIKLIIKLIKNEILYSAYIEKTLIKELSMTIDKQILTDLFKLGNK